MNINYINNMNHITNIVEVIGYDMMKVYEKDNKFYIVDWYDTNNFINKWLIFQIDITSLYKLINEEYSIKKIYDNITDFYSIESKSSTKEYFNLKKINIEEIPIEKDEEYYIEKDDCFQCDKLKKYLNKKIRKNKLKRL